MKIQSLTLKNIGHFKDLTIDFAPLEEGKPRVTVFIGNNGSGKTNILKSLVTALSWLPARIRKERGRGLDIPEQVIHNDEHSAFVSLNVWAHEREFVWTLSKVRQGKKNQFSSDFKAVSEWADIYRTQLTENQNVNLPLMVFYPVERSVLDIPFRIRTRHHFEQLNAYDNALEMGVDFRSFFEWFKNEENFEREFKEDTRDKLEEYKIERDLLEEDTPQYYLLTEYIDNYQNILDGGLKFLNIIRRVVSDFLEFKKISVKSRPLRMMVSKNGKEFNVPQLSQGEKSLMALVGDIARRLAMLNPTLENPLEGQGVIMIDEADLHLHPQWQRQLIDRLTKTFPNCQFILSTHSPLVISDSKDIVVYSLENGEMSRLPSQYGQDANTVLLNAMDTDERNSDVRQQLNQLFISIQNNDLDKAKSELATLQNILPSPILELSQAQLLMKKQELRNEINQKKP